MAAPPRAHRVRSCCPGDSIPQRRGAIRAVRPWAIDVRAASRPRTGRRSAKGIKDPPQIAAFIEEVRGADVRSARRSRGHFGPYGGTFVPETLMPALRGADAPPTSARGDDPAVRRRARVRAARLRRPADARCTAPSASPRTRAARRSTSSARTSTTPARTRSTTRSGRRCSRGAWARRASSPRRAPASTASRRRRSPRCFGLECVGLHGRRGHASARRSTSSA